MGRQAVAAWCYVCLPVESIPAAGMAGAIRASAKPASRPEDAPTTVTAAATVLGMTMFLGTVGNMMVLYSFLQNKALRTAANGLIANLSAADLVACTVASPIALVVVLSQDPLPPPVCDLQTFFSTLCNLVTLLMLVGISVDRWLNINYPFTG
ncbi:5-hydroxytryptamine receptor-like [Branchiostoma floridae]|uniref:5-hydroxytryptamine receptor-like n=1 Tax=Branchiostoma floridae TaxID=7739 RepID=A0A9J7LZK3_BRAFL|nr:5-hydroxytryptamine receptor-like [Branchiostoma floridae]